MASNPTHEEAKNKAEEAYWVIYSPALDAYRRGNTGSFEQFRLERRNLEKVVIQAMEAYWQTYRDTIKGLTTSKSK